MGIFGLEFEKAIVILEFVLENPRICLNAKSRKKQKCLNLQPKMPYEGIFGPEFSKKLLSYLKSASSNFSKHKIS